MKDVSTEDLLCMLQTITTDKDESEQNRETAIRMIMAIGDASRVVMDETTAARTMRAQGLEIAAKWKITCAQQQAAAVKATVLSIAEVLFPSQMKQIREDEGE